MQKFLRKYFGWFIDWLSNLIGKINWTQSSPITAEDKEIITQMLKTDYYIIATRHRNHLSTWAIALASFLTTGKFSFYGHVLMNLEDDVTKLSDFRLVEAIGTGSTYSTFEEVFGNADAVCLLKPKNLTINEWTSVLDKAKNQIGKPYDTLFDLANDQAVSCVELCRVALQADPDYSEDFAEFEVMIKKIDNLTPQMFRDCADFEVAFEVKR